MKPPQSQITPAVEVVVEGRGDAPVVLCCEHASNALPDGMQWEDDAWLRDMHWAWDPGAAEVTRALARAFGARAVLSRVSRLVIDVNRPTDSDTLCRQTADGRRVELNHGLDPGERQQRVADWWAPYHETLDAVCAAAPATVLLAIHSFSPVYEGHRREVELGVLFDHSEGPATDLMRALQPSGLVIRPNEPWSGRHQQMYSCNRHSRQHGLHGVELELRQDLLADPATRDSIIGHVERAVREVCGIQ